MYQEISKYVIGALCGVLLILSMQLAIRPKQDNQIPRLHCVADQARAKAEVLKAEADKWHAIASRPHPKPPVAPKTIQEAHDQLDAIGITTEVVSEDINGVLLPLGEVQKLTEAVALVPFLQTSLEAAQRETDALRAAMGEKDQEVTALQKEIDILQKSLEHERKFTVWKMIGSGVVFLGLGLLL